MGVHIIDDVTAAELSKNLNRKIKRKEEERKKEKRRDFFWFPLRFKLMIAGVRGWSTILIRDNKSYLRNRGAVKFRPPSNLWKYK